MADLYFTLDKFAHLQFWLKNYPAAIYFIDNTSAKDLGLIITQSLTWESHYKLTSGKAYKILGLICRSFTGSGPIMTTICISH